jgi:hypothetical protein
MALTVMKMVRAITGGDESVGDINSQITVAKAKLAASQEEILRLGGAEACRRNVRGRGIS